MNYESVSLAGALSMGFAHKFCIDHLEPSSVCLPCGNSDGSGASCWPRETLAVRGPAGRASGSLVATDLKSFAVTRKSLYKRLGFLGQLYESILPILIYFYKMTYGCFFFLRSFCRLFFLINAPDFGLSFHYRNRDNLGHLGQNQIRLSGGVI